MARSTSFGKDTGLQTRMLLTMFGLGLVYVIFIGALIGGTGLPIPLVLVGIAALFAFQYFSSEGLALRAMGAREVSPQEAPELHAMIERLCIQADIPKPRVAVADQAQPNAFALGRSPKHADRLRDDGHHEPALPRRTRGRHGP